MRLLYTMPDGLAVIFIPIILGMIIVAVVQSVRDLSEMKNWVRGEDWERTDINNGWVTAKMSSDYDLREFKVRFNPLDGYFYDEEGYNYSPNEIQIKIDG